MSNSFDPYAYDKYMALKVTPLLWLIILWATHHLLVLGLSAFSRSGQVFYLVSEYAGHTPLILSNLPALIVLLIALNRSPASGRAFKWLWRHGKKLLILALASSAALTVFYHQRKITSPDNLFFWAVLIYAAVILYLLTSRRIAAIFADFPVEAAADAKPARIRPDHSTGS